LPRSLYLMSIPELCLESVAFQKIVKSSASAFHLNNHHLANLGLDSSYHLAMILYA
jgi:hypothetical protein